MEIVIRSFHNNSILGVQKMNRILCFIIGWIGIIYGAWFLYSVSYRTAQTEDWIRKDYEKKAKKKRKRLIITYNPAGSQYYPRQT